MCRPTSSSGANARDLRQYYVRSNAGQMVPLDNLVALTETSGPQVINHYNLFRSAEIDGSPAEGFSSGQGLANMEKLFNKYKLPGMTFDWTGLALEEVESQGKALIIFGLGLLVVYLTLSAQYESFFLPFIILLAVPMAVLGALGLVAARGISDDVYVQIGLVMLIGLSAKNSILIVEFAEQQLEHGQVDHRRGDCRGGTAPAADPDDQLRVHPGRDAALLRHRSGCAGAALGGHGGGGRDAGVDHPEPVLYSGAVRAVQDGGRGGVEAKASAQLASVRLDKHSGVHFGKTNTKVAGLYH